MTGIKTPDTPRIFSTDRRIRLGVWGLGRGFSLISLADTVNVDVVAGCDFNPHVRESFHKRLPDCRLTDDAEEFLSWDFDAVAVATYCPAHADDVIRCLDAGKHVLSEVTAFHTPAEGVRLVEAVERSGKVYQLAENYPYSPVNRYLARKWAEGFFGELAYAEYAYFHDCLDLSYTFLDGTPIEPGHEVHNWRSWLPWHFYCTHSLGPVMVITGTRPVRVVSVPGSQQIPGHIHPDGLGGMAPSLIEMDNGGIVRNLMGGGTFDKNSQFLVGTRAGSLIEGRDLTISVGGRGHSPRIRVTPDDDEVGRFAAKSGHGGGDFWALYHFANEILHGVKGPFDVYTAADVTLPGILAYRSSREEGRSYEVPDFRDPAQREAWRKDDGAPERIPVDGAFSPAADRCVTAHFSPTMKRLLQLGDRWQAFADGLRLFDVAREPEAILHLGEQVLEGVSAFPDLIAYARTLIALEPESEGARALREVLSRLDLDLLSAPDARTRIEALCDDLAARLPEWDGDPDSATGVPQLRMKRRHLNDLPTLALPAGFSLRSSRPGTEDATNWSHIIEDSFGYDHDDDFFRRAILEHRGYAPDRLFFIEDKNGLACAVAAGFGEGDQGYIHFVGVLGTHQGNRLGYHVSLAALHSLRDRGCAAAVLATDHYRLPAIRTYQRLGFVPHTTHRSHPKRWQRIAEVLDSAAATETRETDTR